MRLSFRRRLAAAVVLSAVAGTTAATAGDDLVACREKGRFQVRKDNWTRVNPFPVDSNEGVSRIVAFAASPRDSNRMLVTNGEVVKLTGDGGCTWDRVAKGSEVRVPNATDSDVYTHLAFTDVNSAWAASYDDNGGATSPHVRQFTNLKEGAVGSVIETRADTGLPPVGKPIALTASRANDGSTAHVLIEQPPDGSNQLEAAHQLYVIREFNDPPQLTAAGAMWHRVAPPADFGRIEGMTEGAGPNDLWIWSKDKIAFTANISDDAPTWSVSPAGGTPVTIDVNITGVALAVIRTQQGTSAQLLNVTGKAAGAMTLPADATSVTHGSLIQTRAISGPEGTWGFDARARRWVDITPKGAGALAALEMGYGKGGRILLGQTEDAVWRFDLYGDESFLPGTGLRGSGPPPIPHSEISQPYIDAPRTVTVKPGQVKDVPVEFGMPANANPLDVYFLLDTTSSMQATIEGLTRAIKDISAQLRLSLGRDACFGLGSFKDLFAAGAAEADRVFRTHLPITCEDESLPKMSTALADRENVYASGGGDIPEAHTIALNQMITGEGQAHPPVLPGQAAQFRPGAYKVVVLLTDVGFKQGTGYPDTDATAKTLSVNGIKVVNVLVMTNDGDKDGARRDMTRLATATKSYAPEGGVDCDGDGEQTAYDVFEGAPLICESDGDNPNLGPLIVSLLLGVQDPGTLAVDIQDPQDAVREPIRGATSAIFNLKRDARLKFTLPVSCRKDQVGLDLPILLTPSVRAAVLPLVHTILVQCRLTLVPPVPPKPRPPLPPIIEPEPPAPQLPRVPIAIALPPPPNPPPQPPSNMNFNAGFSQQEEQQFQLAAVTQGAGEDAEPAEELELAMSGLETDDSATPVAAFLAGAAILSAAAGAAHRRRLQRATRTAHARVF